MVLEEVQKKFGDKDVFWYEEGIPDKTNGWIYQGSLGLADIHAWIYPNIYSDSNNDDSITISTVVTDICNSGYKVEVRNTTKTLEILEEYYGGYETKKGTVGLTERGDIEVLKSEPQYKQKMYFWQAVNKAIEWMKENSPEEAIKNWRYKI